MRLNTCSLVSPAQYHSQLPALHNTTHTHLTALCLGLPMSASTRKVKPICILLKQETVSGSGITWTICKQSAPRSRQITMPAPHHSVFYRLDALPSAQPTASKHRKHNTRTLIIVVRVIWHKVASPPPHIDRSVIFATSRQCALLSNARFLGPA